MIIQFYKVQMQHNLKESLKHKIQLRKYTQFIKCMTNQNQGLLMDSIRLF